MTQPKSFIADMTDQLVCCVPFSMHGSGSEFYALKESGGTAIALTPIRAHMLSQMTTAKTLGSWLNTLCENAIDEELRSHKHPALRQLRAWTTSIIQRYHEGEPSQQYERLPLYKSYSQEAAFLLQTGLLAPVGTDLRNGLHTTCTPEIARRITAICIPTCGRATYLARCVKSFSENLRLHRRTDATLLVVDDSSSSVSESDNRVTASQFCCSDGPHITFVGREERQDFIKKLLRQDAARPEIVNFALNADKLLTTVGSVRNTILLLTSGQHILQTDDDTVCAYASQRSDPGHLIVSSRPDPCETYFFNNQADNHQASPLNFHVDALAAHESILGQTLLSLSQSAREITWDQTNPHMFSDSRMETAFVDITTTGISGDAGMGSNLGFLAASSETTRKRIYKSAASLKVASESREILRIVPCLTLSLRPTLMTMSVGINNDRLQPPFFPLGRNQDGAFAQLYRIVNRQSLIGHLPLAISHQSEPNRCYSPRPSDVVCRLQLTDIAQMCFSSIALSAGASVAQNLRSAGEQLIGISSGHARSFRAFLRDRFVYTRLQLLQELEETSRTSHFKDREWLSQMDSVFASMKLSLVEQDAIAPSDLRDRMSYDEALTKAQTYIQLYGALLRSWSDMQAASRQVITSLEFLKTPFQMQ